MNQPLILILAVWYSPAYEKGGSVVSIENIVNALKERFRFRIITMGCNSESVPYPGIILNSWNRVGGADVYYFSSYGRALLMLRTLVSQIDYDILYLNSFFQPVFTGAPLLLRRLGLIEKKPVVLAPRGEFSEGAVTIKRKKKMFYIDITRKMNLYEDIAWQASSEQEANETRLVLPGINNIVVAPDISAWTETDLIKQQNNINKQINKLRIVFLSRISRKKNIVVALEILTNVSGYIEFDIFGPIEDAEYWDECKKMINEMPDNIDVNYRGEVKHEDVRSVFSQYHLFLFPTLGENFGHVILESLLSGCPVLISDQTPWHDLQETGAGWEVPLKELNVFREVIESLSRMTNQEFMALSERATEYGKSYLQDDSIFRSNLHLFMDLLSSDEINDGLEHENTK